MLCIWLCVGVSPGYPRLVIAIVLFFVEATVLVGGAPGKKQRPVGTAVCAAGGGQFGRIGMSKLADKCSSPKFFKSIQAKEAAGLPCIFVTATGCNCAAPG